MTKRFRLESVTEMGDNFAVVLVDENGSTSLHSFTPDALERFRGREPLTLRACPPHERVGTLPPVWSQRIDILMSRREAL